MHEQGVMEDTRSHSVFPPYSAAPSLFSFQRELDLMSYFMRNLSCARHRLAKFGSCGNRLFKNLAARKVDQFA
jgi:hypothetical protein